MFCALCSACVLCGRDEDDDYGEEVIFPEQTWSDEEDDITINLYGSEDDDE